MLAIPTSAKTNFIKSNLRHKVTVTSKRDMFRYGLIHVTGITGTALIVFEFFSLQQTLQL